MCIYIYTCTHVCYPIHSGMPTPRLPPREATSALKEVEASVTSYEATLKVPCQALVGRYPCAVDHL